MKRLVAILPTAMMLAACQPRGDDLTLPIPSSLSGTTWQLAELQSMDDAQGTARPDNPAKYTLDFGVDGRVTAQLDCNRGSGAWQSAAPGTLVIASLATTRAMCPPPSLGARFAQQLEYVRSYIMKDGRLYLSLMADGGIIVMEPSGAK